MSVSCHIRRKLRQEEDDFEACLASFVRFCLKKIQKSRRLSLVVQTCDPSTREVKGKGSEI